MKSILMLYPKVGLDIKGSSVFLPLSVLYPLSNLKGYNLKVIDQRLEPNWKDRLKSILNKEVLCIGISFMSGAQIKNGLEMIDYIKTINPNIKIIAGGVHPSLLPEQTLEEKNIDIVVMGEGEETFPELVKALEKNQDLNSVKGICFKKDNKFIRTGERDFIKLKNLPNNLYNLVNIKDYLLSWFSSVDSLSLLTGRGCPHRCGFCYNKVFNKYKWRPLEVEEMIEGVKTIIKLGGKTIELLDDNFFTDIKRIEKFCNLLKKENIKIKFVSNCRVDYIARMDDSTLKLLKECGFIEFYVGVESGCNETLKRIKKDITIEQLFIADEKLRRANINPLYSFIAGFPGEKFEDTKKTIQVMLKLIKLNPNASLTGLKIFTPFPGTDLYEECKTLGFQPPKTFREWGYFDYNNTKYSWRNKKEDKLLEKLSYITYFLDEKSVIKVVNKKYLNPLIKLYSKIARFRCKHNFYFFAPEVFIMKRIKNLI